MQESDWPAAQRIFAEGIATGDATFESEAPDWPRFDSTRLKGHRLVAETPAGEIVGWAAVSAVSGRTVYAGVVEHSVYVAAAARGRGAGKVLLAALVQSTESAGIWTIQANVFPENQASLNLHLGLGFTIVGRRVKIARMTHGPAAGKWRDTVLIERRSPVI
ncbi:MAG TPA: GNAT family N-acetyltransferase [Arthrobacter sp.]|jgi:phosphinothricin acetyltransferase